MSLKKIAVLYGDIKKKSKDEIDVLIEVNEVLKTLKFLGYKPVIIPVTLNIEKLKKNLLKLNPFCVFNLVESIESKDKYIHFVPALLEDLKLPYTGSQLNSIMLTSNKIIAKSIFLKNKILTPQWHVIGGKESLKNIFKPPYIIKSQLEHASIGLNDQSVIFDKNKLISIIDKMFTNHDYKNYFVESYIDGREFNIALLENKNGLEILPPSEILFKNFPSNRPKIVGYDAKWNEDSFEFYNTPRTFVFSEKDTPLLEELKRISLRCWEIFNLKGYARVDFRVDRENCPWVLEINVNPCISPDSGFYAAVKEAGFDYHELIKMLIDVSVSS